MTTPSFVTPSVSTIASVPAVGVVVSTTIVAEVVERSVVAEFPAVSVTRARILYVVFVASDAAVTVYAVSDPVGAVNVALVTQFVPLSRLVSSVTVAIAAVGWPVPV